jgi:hypothetical protein
MPGSPALAGKGTSAGAGVSPTLNTPYAVTHGADLTVSNVGPWALQNVPQGSEVLLNVAGPVSHEDVVTTFPGFNAPPSWMSSQPYVYNNHPSNHGGILAADTRIDGWLVPAGTWIAQFMDFGDQGLSIQGDAAGSGTAWPGVMFRGCRMRATPSLAPGFFNQNVQRNDGLTWFNFCDAGGLAAFPSSQTPGAPQFACESVYQDQGLGPPDRTYMIRCYLSYAVTFIQAANSGDAMIECYMDNNILWFDPNGPNAGYYHYNTYDIPGGQNCNLFLRNHMSLSPQPPGQPWYGPGTVSYQMAADGGTYLGTGTNIDGSTGFQARDNYLGGCVFTLHLGFDKGNTQADITGVNFSGNKFTTYWFETIGSSDIAYHVCTFGSFGNTWTNNTYADDYGAGNWDPSTGNTGRPHPAGNGPLAGTAISAPPPG